MHILYETDNYELLTDSYYGVARFRRKHDDALTLLETGDDARKLRDDMLKLYANTQSPTYPRSAPHIASVFDTIASEYQFIKD